MTGTDTVATCLRCGRPITGAEPYVAVLWQHERIARRGWRRAVTVDRSDEVAHLHEGCADEAAALRVSTAVTEAVAS